MRPSVVFFCVLVPAVLSLVSEDKPSHTYYDSEHVAIQGVTYTPPDGSSPTSSSPSFSSSSVPSAQSPTSSSISSSPETPTPAPTQPPVSHSSTVHPPVHNPPPPPAHAGSGKGQHTPPPPPPPHHRKPSDGSVFYSLPNVVVTPALRAHSTSPSLSIPSVSVPADSLAVASRSFLEAQITANALADLNNGLVRGAVAESDEDTIVSPSDTNRNVKSLLSDRQRARSVRVGACPQAGEFPYLAGNLSQSEQASFSYRQTTMRSIWAANAGGFLMFDSFAVNPPAGTARSVVSGRVLTAPASAPTLSVAYFAGEQDYVPPPLNPTLVYNFNNGNPTIAFSLVLDSLFEFQDRNGNGVYDDGSDIMLSPPTRPPTAPFSLDPSTSPAPLFPNTPNQPSHGISLTQQQWDQFCINSAEDAVLYKVANTTNLVSVPESNDVYFSIQASMSKVAGVTSRGSPVNPLSMLTEIEIADFPFTSSTSELCLRSYVVASSSTVGSASDLDIQPNGDNSLRATNGKDTVYLQWPTVATDSMPLKAVFSSLTQQPLSGIGGLSSHIFAGKQAIARSLNICFHKQSSSQSSPKVLLWNPMLSLTGVTSTEAYVPASPFHPSTSGDHAGTGYTNGSFPTHAETTGSSSSSWIVFLVILALLVVAGVGAFVVWRCKQRADYAPIPTVVPAY